MSSGEYGRVPCYMAIAAISKKMNVGLTMRSCVAFGVSELWVCGGSDYRSFGSHGTERFLPVRDHLRGVPELLAYARERGVHVCAIEITPDAVPVHTFAFRGPTVFLAGNEGEGLSEGHKAALRAGGADFVYIPHYGRGTASLNVSVATSIVLHHFGVWAGYAEVGREEGREDKFEVGAPPPKSGPGVGGAWAEIADAKRADRAAKRAASAGERLPESPEGVPSEQGTG
jgi:hypothetical protein